MNGASLAPPAATVSFGYAAGKRAQLESDNDPHRIIRSFFLIPLIPMVAFLHLQTKEIVAPLTTPRLSEHCDAASWLISLRISIYQLPSPSSQRPEKKTLESCSGPEEQRGPT
jgi:hypothetical protein